MGFLRTSRYEIRRKIGQGGMGVVYEAFDRQRQIVVALKMLTRVSPAGIYRLKQEFRSLAELRHPNLITLYDLAQIGDRWLFTMDLVKGVELMPYVRPAVVNRTDKATVTGSSGLDWLDDYASGDPDAEPSAAFDEARLRATLIQLAQCLRAIHHTGRVHRDLKPSNILVQESGEIVLLDFGLVTRHDGDDLASLQSTIVGTPAYMAPEQASNDAPTPAVDWYAVGVILYEALTGVRPFGGSMIQLLTSKQNSEPRPPSALVRGLPEDLATLAVDLLRRKPAARPSGDQMLRRLTASDPDSEPPPPPSRRRSLIGREDELAQLYTAFEQASSQGAHVLEIRSPAGMGRTLLLRTFLSSLASNTLVLAGRCQEQEAVPYKAFDAAIDALSRHLRHLDQDEVASMVSPSIGALTRIFPVLDRVAAIARTRGSLPDIPDVHTFRRHAFGALRELLDNLAKTRRVLLVIDDIHWGDTDSAAMLEELLRPPSPHMLIVASYRETDQQSPMVRAISDGAFRRRAAATWSTMDLCALSSTNAYHLARTLVANDELAEHVAKESLGVPLWVVELARHTAAHPTRALTLDAIFDQRILELPLGSRALLEVLALAAAPTQLAVAAQAASATPEQKPDARIVAELSARYLLRSSWYRGRASLAIFSDHVRRAVLRTLPPEGHRRTHLRLATALEQAGAPAELVAHHRAHAGDARDAALGMMLAGEAAMQSLAFHRAVRLFECADTLLTDGASEHGALQERLGEALAASGRSSDAARRFLHAARSSGARRDAFELQRLAAEHLLRSGHIDEGLEVVAEVLRAVGLSLPTSPRRALSNVVLQRARLRLRGLEPSDTTELTHLERRKMQACWSIAVGLSLVDTIVGADFHARHLMLALDSGDRVCLGRALALEAGHVGSTDPRRQPRAVELLDRVDALAQDLQDPKVYGLARLMRGGMALFTARWRDAVTFTDEAARVFRERCSDVAWELASAWRFNHVALYYLGEIAQLCDRVPAAMADARSRGDRFAESCAGSGGAVVVWLASGDVHTAQAFLAEETQRWGTSRFAVQHFLALQALTLTDLYDGQSVRARDRLAEVWPRVKSSMLLRVHLLKHTMLALRARTALAAATCPADLDAAEGDASKLGREGLASSLGLATLIRAGVRRRHDVQAAIPLYETAIQLLGEAQMKLHAAAAQIRLGEILGGDEGKAHRVQATTFMRAQRIAAPERFVAMLAP